MGNIEKRIERLEDYAPGKPEKLIALLSKLRGFKLRYDLGDDPSEEEVEAAIRRMSSHSNGAVQRNRRRPYD